MLDPAVGSRFHSLAGLGSDVVGRVARGFMVVRDIIPALSELLGREVIAHNSSVFRGEGSLGADFERALLASSPYGGTFFVESLVNVSNGKIVEILQPDPMRAYEKEIVNALGERITTPIELSTRNPGSRLAVFIVDATGRGAIIDVIARDEISPEARACLRESILEFSSHKPIRSRAA